MPAFWDASCVLPLVVPAQRSRDAAQLLRAHAPVVWWGTHVEVQSGLARLKQEGALSATACESSRKKLAAMLASWGQIQPDEQVRETALKQLDHFPLRGGDALQLAAALVWTKQKPRGRIFVVNDRRLRDAALALGFAIETI